MTQQEALQILKKYTTKPNLIKHAKAVAECMRHFAQLFGDDPEYWAVIGLLHDIDYEMFPDEHCLKCEEILREEGFDDRAIHNIQSHGCGLACKSVDPDCEMEMALLIVDQLSGFIIACALMKPDKKLSSVDLASIKKRWKEKSFASGTGRDRIIEWCDKLGKDFDYMAQETLNALNKISDELGI